MIDHTYRCIFIHQRKCAGTTISQAFGYHWLKNDESYRPYSNGVIDNNWSSRPHDYFVFSVIRNPFDRLISGWKQQKTTRDLPLEAIVEEWPKEFGLYNHISRPQVVILKDRKTGQLVTDDLIRYESLQSDFDRVCEKIGKPRIQLPHLNSSVRERGYRDYFTGHTRKLVEAHFAEDFEKFGYEF